MAIRLVDIDVPESSFGLAQRNVFESPKTSTLINELFGGNFVGINAQGDGLILCWQENTIAEVKGNQLKWALGRPWAVGTRDGIGIDATFGLAQTSSLIAINPDFYLVTEPRYNQVRKLTRLADGQWQAALWAVGLRGEGMTSDGKFVYINNWDTIHKYDLTGKEVGSFMGIATASVHGLQYWEGKLVIWDRRNWATTIYWLDPNDGHRIDKCGYTEEELTALFPNNFDAAPADGPFEACTLHTCDPFAFGQGWVYFGGGGDEQRGILVDTVARTTRTLKVDGTFGICTNRKINSGDLVFYYMSVGAGADTDKLPFQTFYNWSGWSHRSFRKATKIDIDVVITPPPSGGGSMEKSEFDSWIIPNSFVTGQSVEIVVKLKNTGDVPWSKSTLHRAGAQKPDRDSVLFGQRLELADGVIVNPGEVGTFKLSILPPAPGTYEVQWRTVHDQSDTTGPAEWFGASTPIQSVSVLEKPQGVNMKNVIVNWVTQDTAVLNADKANHFVVTLDGASANEPLTVKSHTFMAIAAGPHTGTIACADINGVLLSPSVPFSVSVPNDPTAPIPVSVTVTLG